ncbi:MAG: AAA family ATPase [Chloroflexota bacterium]
MKVRFKNIGAVKEAEIDLSKKLIVFCGPNNTGKTYLAYCVYLLSKGAFPTRVPLSSPLPNILDNDNINILKQGKGTVNLYDLFIENNDYIKEVIEFTFKTELPQAFGLDFETKEKLFGKAEVEILFDNNDIVNKLIWNEKFTANFGLGVELLVTFTKKRESHSLEITLTQNEPIQEESIKALLVHLITSNLFQSIISTFIPNTYIAPVERNSIYTFSKELSIQRNILVDKMLELNTQKSRNDNPFDMINRRATRYPLPIRDGLEVAEDLANYQKRTTEFVEFADCLEKDILDGKINITKEGEIQFLPNKAKGLKLPIHITASIVKSFSSLIIYFKHLARHGDMIIIDEPELNLHPDAQIKVARIIAQIVNKGFKVLINTHSDYIVREMNNLIMLSSITVNSNGILGELGYATTDALKPENVGAYLFDYDHRTKIYVKNLEVSKEGFEAPTMDNVINDLNERAQNLYFNIQDTDNEY